MKLGEKPKSREGAGRGDKMVHESHVIALTAESVTAQLPPLITCHHWVL